MKRNTHRMARFLVRGVIVAAGVALASHASAQEPPAGGHAQPAATHAGGHALHPRIEAEAIGSTIFQSALAAVRLGNSPALFESQFFGVDGNDIGIVGLSWELRLGGLRVMPGLGWGFGRENRPAPVVTARWAYLDDRWLTQGVFVQSLRAHIPSSDGEHTGRSGEATEDIVEHSGAFEGHASLVLRALEVGPVVEHIRYREENAWKGGARGAWRLTHAIKIVTQVLAPDPEFRIGLAFEP